VFASSGCGVFQSEAQQSDVVDDRGMQEKHLQGVPVLVARNAPGYYALQLLSACAMAALGAWIVHGTGGPPAWLGWICLLVAGICGYVLTSCMFDQRPRIVIDRDGVFDRALGVGPIPWSDVRSAQALTLLGKDFIRLDLYNTEYWVAQMPLSKRFIADANRRFGFAALNVYLTGTSLSPTLALEVMRKHMAGTRSTPSAKLEALHH
jgi:hypothetical protein